MLRVQIVLRVFCLALLAGAPILAHGPHELAAPEKGTPGAAIPLPAGWVESRPPAGAGALAPMLAADGDGFLATWIEPLAQAGHRVRFARWQGGSWRAATTIRESASLFANWADVPGVVRAPDGALHAWWLEKSGPDTYAYDVRLARSTDHGATFSALGVLHDDRSPVEHGFVSAVPERAGVRFYYLDGRATARAGPMQLRTVLVEGERIGPSELVDDSVCDCCSTAAAGLASGSAVAYRDRTTDEIRDVQVVLRSDAAPPAMHAPGKDGWKIAGCPVNGPALAANGGELALAWFTAPGDRPRMVVARSADGGANWSVPVTVASAKPMGQLALAPLDSGYALSWLEATPGGSELRLARLDGSGRLGPSVALARTGAGRSAGIPRLAATANRLALLWVDAGKPSGTSLRFATQVQ
ncbi:MAG: hypothetical protein QG573_1337 [Acidobacteriota bacterium]|nr:hypothetical protein [Acidobacteriota bacterium]